MMAVRVSACMFVCIMAAVWDWRTRRIPNTITYCALAVGLVLAAVDQSLGLKWSLVGTVTAGGLFLLFWSFRAVGAGDVKLIAAVGAFIGFPNVFDVVFLSALAGGVLGILWLIWKPSSGTHATIAEPDAKGLPRGTAPTLRERLRTERIPYAVAILVGFVVWSGFLLFGVPR